MAKEHEQTASKCGKVTNSEILKSMETILIKFKFTIINVCYHVQMI